MSSPLVHSSTVQGFRRQIDLEMYGSMVAFQKIKFGWVKTVLAGAVLGLSPGTVLMAQSSSEDTLPVPQARPSLDSYSLPPGPGQTSEQNVLQGPVDEEIPVARPRVVTPRATPAEPASDANKPATKPAAATNLDRQPQQPVRPVLPPRESEARTVPEETNPALEKSAAIADERPETVDTTAKEDGIIRPPAEPPAVPASAANSKDWPLFLVAALFFVLLGALFLWRARRGSVKQQVETIASDDRPRQIVASAKVAEPLQPAPAISIAFHPHRANTTLLNAVVGFELILSNPGDELLTDIKVFGAMGQAGEQGSESYTTADAVALHAIPHLGNGDREEVTSEFRIPLTHIQPIMFRSQALFVPLVQISIEFADAAGFQHFQTANYLVGLEHQPPRQKMAPFRLDLGPRSFAPLGHRPFATG